MKLLKKTLIALALMFTPAFANIPRSDGIIRDNCYMQELNHQYNQKNGELKYSIIIY